MNEPKPQMPGNSDSSKVQGEGDYESARRYDQAQQDFVKSGKVDEAARKAKPQSEAERKEMEQAEKTGLSHSKGEDPALPHSTKLP